LGDGFDSPFAYCGPVGLANGQPQTPAPKRAGRRRPVNVSGAIAAKPCQHFVTMFGDYSPMTRDENINAVIQGLRERSGLPAACMKAAKIAWPRPLAIGQLAHVAIGNAHCPSSGRPTSRSEPKPPQQPALP
jgi:hypothetical protein